MSYLTMKACKMAKIAKSLPDEVLKDIEEERLATGETRSEFLRRVVETYFRHKREKEAVEQYIRGYQEFPEWKEESNWVESTLKLAYWDVPYESDDMGL